MDIPLNQVFKNIGDARKEGLQRLGIATVSDLLHHFPTQYLDFSLTKKIEHLQDGEFVTLKGKFIEINLQRAWRKKIPIARGLFEDSSGTLPVLWFNQAYAASSLPTDTLITISGKVKQRKNGTLWMANPLWYILDGSTQRNTAALRYVPVYPHAKGVPSRWIQAAIKKILKYPELLPNEYLPEDILEQYHLPRIPSSYLYIHQPRNEDHIEAAKKRFAFEEVFLIQLARLQKRRSRSSQKALQIAHDEKIMPNFINGLDLTLTSAQKRALDEILKDLNKSTPMARLLQGDVGSGKTLVAIAASLAAAAAGHQVVYMAPTEILAQQQFEEFKKRLGDFNMTIGLLTSSYACKFPSKVSYEPHAKVSKTRLLKWLEEGSLNILIGTHSLFQEKVRYNSMALAIIDEQHRFGIHQRAALTQKQKTTPHLLSMTATPIPRTLALTIYGDLDISVLDEMPLERLITSRVIGSAERDKTYSFLQEKIRGGHQLFVICPRIESTKSKGNWETKTVTAEYKKLTTIFPEFKIAKLHGKMLPKEKTQVIEEFRDKKTHILVSTSVIEVGMDIPNATLMLVEGSERFGLAQLHQFRGRIGRRGQEAFCFFVLETNSPKSSERLQALVNTKDGFELAEYDLQFRGAGQLTGSSQWGVSDIGMEALKNIKLVEAARSAAHDIIEKDHTLESYLPLHQKIKSNKILQLHLE